MRKGWRFFSLERKAVIAAAQVRTPRYNKDGSRSKVDDVSYRCTYCLELVKEYDVDHVEPVGERPPWPPTGNGEWERYFLRVDCSRANLVLSCKPCHRTKSAQEKSSGAYKRTT